MIPLGLRFRLTLVNFPLEVSAVQVNPEKIQK